MKILRALLHDNANDRWLSFQNPVEVLATSDAGEVLDVLRRVEARVEADQLTAVGFVSYEAASGFDAALSTHQRGSLPLLCFALFAKSEVMDVPLQSSSGQLWRFTESTQSYRDRVDQIRDLIAQGTVYQVNYTTRLRGQVHDAEGLFAEVAAGAPHGAFLLGDSHTLISASPECFFSLAGEHIYSQPMKGTAARCKDPDEDRAQASWLLNSAKNQAENLMITDMVRNDLGRIATAGSVRVSELFALEKYPTVWQLTSRVEAQTRASVTEIFQQLFPAASITGAPKKSAMEQICRLEAEPREIYTGAIGFIAPNRRAHFNIAIRTAWIENASGIARYGAGGGMVWDSNPAEELQELLAKTRVLQRVVAMEDFELFETLAWSEQEGAINLQAHLARMHSSARVFGLPVAECEEFTVRVQRAIQQASEACQMDASSDQARLRITLNGYGECEAVLTPLPPLATGPQRVALAASPVHSQDPALAHKTNQRQLYVQARAQVCDDHGAGCEPLLVNERGEITESDIANVVFVLDDKFYTPPLSSGLLPGTLRGRLLARGELEERVLLVEELAEISSLYLINDLRGWRAATWIKS